MTWQELNLEKISFDSQDHTRQLIEHPQLKRQIEQALERDDSIGSYIIRENHRLYISLDSIEPGKQERCYKIIKQYQAGERTDLSELPSALQMILQPQYVVIGYFFVGLILSAFIGTVLGVLAMAVGMIVMATSEMTIYSRMGVDNSGLPITAVIFVVSTIFGWIISASIMWYRARRKVASLVEDEF